MWELVSQGSDTATTMLAVNEETGGKVAGRIHDQVGDPPLCHHELPAQMFICRKEGPNFMKLFWRCPHPRSYQCQYFMWTRTQPLLVQDRKNLDSMIKELEQSQDPYIKTKAKPSKPSSSGDPPRVRPGQCVHPKTTKAGSNAFQAIEKCVACGQILSKTMTELGRQKHIARWGTPPTLSPEEAREWKRMGMLEKKGVWLDPNEEAQ